MKFRWIKFNAFFFFLASYAFTNGDTCPEHDLSPDANIGSEEIGEPNPLPADFDQDVKNFNTEFVVKNFFSNRQDLFNFMKLVYGSIDKALQTYKQKHSLEDRAVFLLFKGGNVLRIIANNTFALVKPDARAILENEYAPYFQRSDADFSVYVDEKKLKGLNYDNVINEVSLTVMDQLNLIRNEFYSVPQKYFSLFQLKKEDTTKTLKDAFDRLVKLPAVSNASNSKWYRARFYQYQLPERRARESFPCEYIGQHDYRFTMKEGNFDAQKISNTPGWIANSDNRVIEFPWGSDPKKFVKFFLVRSKAFFDIAYTQSTGKAVQRPIGGELIDVSLPHRRDDRLRSFLDSYDHAVATYTLTSEDTGETLNFKSYSLMALVEDLSFILFDSFQRPWLGGSKYGKRVNRLFFLYALEQLAKYGQGAGETVDYLNMILRNIVEPLEKLYPLSSDAAQRAQQIVAKAQEIAHNPTWQGTPLVNEFWETLSTFVANRLTKSPLPDDAAYFKELMNLVRHNLNIIASLRGTARSSVDTKDLYKPNMRSLF